MIEEWRYCFGEKLYEVSSLGRVRSYVKNSTRLGQLDNIADQPHLLKVYIDQNGYPCVCAGPSGRIKRPRRVHTMVVRAFHGEKPFPKAECRHLDGDKTNNNASNLKWGTRKENMADRVRLGESAHSERHPDAKLTEKQVIEIRELYATGEYTLMHLGLMYGLGTRSISPIVRGQYWTRTGGPITKPFMGNRRKRHENLVRFLKSNPHLTETAIDAGFSFDFKADGRNLRNNSMV